MLEGGLLREGTYLLEVKGKLKRQGKPASWTFAPLPGAAPELTEPLVLLPCTLLANLEQLASSMEKEELVFELSGEIFVYRGRNYLLPAHAPRLAGYMAPPPGEGKAAAADVGAEPTQILRDLERAVGPVPRSAASAEAPETARQQTDLLPPGTILLWRRGWMDRQADGAWSFVFEADASGLADPSMILLPCLLLETMEDLAEQSPARAPMLVSGRVFRYHGRNYLHPTSVQMRRQRTPLAP